MNPHWEAFARDLFWFVSDPTRFEVGELLPPGGWKVLPTVAALFPVLSQLLATAHTSAVVIDGEDHVLFSWQRADHVRSWLSPAPTTSAPATLFPAHRLLLGVFGGIIERGGEFAGQWLLNTIHSLTLQEASHDARFLDDYACAFESVPGGIPIDTSAYYSISREANGNTTLCHRLTGELLLFAPDHSFAHLVPLEGCPEYTLYRINGAPSLVDWVEVVARQWLET